MLNKLWAFAKEYDLFHSGDTVVCAVSGGADSMALLWAMYLLGKEKSITVECAHFNHKLRGEESDRDAAFVKRFCMDYGIAFHLGEANVVAGKKGLEAAAREARYAFLRTLPGVIATAHTANDNAETVLMHLLRGTGLKGLGGISPKYGNVVRPMLSVTRQDVLRFLEEYSVSYVDDSSNSSDMFLRNRIRHEVMPVFRGENPKFAENLSDAALRFRQDEDYLERETPDTCLVSLLKAMHPALRTRALSRFLKKNGVLEPNAQHIGLIEDLVFSQNPSASANFPGGVTIARNYDMLQRVGKLDMIASVTLPCPGRVTFGDYLVSADFTDRVINTPLAFTVKPAGEMKLRSRLSGDCIHFAYGQKTLKKLFIDEKIPALERQKIPVLVDEAGLLGVCGYGPDMARNAADGSLIEVRFEHL